MKNPSKPRKYAEKAGLRQKQAQPTKNCLTSSFDFAGDTFRPEDLETLALIHKHSGIDPSRVLRLALAHSLGAWFVGFQKQEDGKVLLTVEMPNDVETYAGADWVRSGLRLLGD